MAWVDQQDPESLDWQDDAWYVEVVQFLLQWIDTFRSPGDRCNDFMTWRERYACTLHEAGGPCPGAPDPRRAALAAQRDPAGARAIRDRLANEANDGLAPSVAEMQDPQLAVLWVHAIMGGWDCINSSDPSFVDDFRAWLLEVVPDWPPEGGVPTPPIGAGLPFSLPTWWPIGAAVVLFLIFAGRS